MAARTANQAAELLLPADLLTGEARATLLGSAMPALLLAPETGRVLWASHAAARLLGMPNGAALMLAGLPANAPGTMRLRQILAAGAGPTRLERLRFTIGFRSTIITAMCSFLDTEAGSAVLCVGLPDATGLAADAFPEAMEPEADAPDNAVPPAALAPPEPVLPALPEAAELPAVAEAATTEDAGAMPGEASWTLLEAEARPVLRFVFALDSNGLVERVSPPLAEAVGAADAALAGQSLAGFVQRFDAEAAAAIRDAVLSGETWPTIRTAWPAQAGRWQVPVTLNALPLRAADDGLTGFSGFGRCDLPAAQAVTAQLPEEPVQPARGDALGMVAAEAAAPDAAGPEDLAEAPAPAIAAMPVPEAPAMPAQADTDTGESAEAATQPEWFDLFFSHQAQEQATADLWKTADMIAALEAFGAGEAEPARAANGPEALAQPSAGDVPPADQASPEAVGQPEDDAAREARETADLIAALSAFNNGETDAITTPPANEAPEAEAPAPETGAAAVPAAEAPPAAPLPPGAGPIDPSQIAAQLDNVIALRQGPIAVPPGQKSGLSHSERNAFREIAKALGAKLGADFDDLTPPRPPQADMPAAETAPPAEPPAPPATMLAAEGPAPAAMVPPDVAVMDKLPVGILVMRDDETLFVNRTLLDLTGYDSVEQFRAEGGNKAIFRKGAMPKDRDSGFDTVVLAGRQGEMMPVDAHLQPVDWQGAPASLLTLRRAVELEQGKALRSVALDLKRVRSEANELRAVLDTATDGVITLDDRGLILSINGSAEALFGLTENEVAGESFTYLLHNDSHADALDYFEGLKANGVRSVLNDGRDVQGREKKGGRIPLFMTLGRISDDEPRRFCAVLRDLTAWKRAESELTEARRAAEMASAKKSDFLTKISHEIRTPMNAIIGFAEVMLEERLGAIGNPKYKEYLGDIRTSGQHVVSLVNDLLDLAKIEAGRMEMRFAATDLNSIVGSCVGIIQPQANAHRVLVRTQLANRLPAVVADERSIRQIILNMLSNATRFTESGGQVIVATALLDTGEAVIRIRDTGIGMTATEIEQALEPFRQVGTRRDHGGTGLGLPLTKALVEANRANFAIRSTPGEGTMVEITFPSTRVLAE